MSLKTNLSRRRFLAQGFSYPLAFSGISLLTSSMAKAVEEVDCLVLGAGIAGLTAARSLTFGNNLGAYSLANESFTGRKVIVLEGADVIGGRVQTNTNFIPGVNLELGAENLHIHPNMSPLWDEVYRYKLNVKYLDPVRMAYLHNSKFLGSPTKNMPAVASQSGLKANIFEALTAEDGKLSLEDWRKKLSGNNQLLYEVMRATFNSPGPLEDNSTEGFVVERYPEMIRSKFESRIIEGNSTLINHLARGLNIIRGQRVVEIEYSDRGVVVVCDNGKIYRAKTAIITFAIGMLKKGGIKFTPNLPDAKLLAFDSLGIGNSIKMILPFKKRFWPDNMSIMIESDSAREAGRVYFQVEAGSENQMPVLNTLIADEDANRLAGVPDQEIARMICRDLDRMFPNKNIAALDLIERNADGSLKILVKNWVKDPFTMGSSSFIKQNSAMNPKLIRNTLADAETTPGLFWAGSDFSTDARVASLDGAHATGLRAALQVHYRLTKNSNIPLKATSQIYDKWYSTRVPAKINLTVDETAAESERPQKLEELEF